MDDKQIVKACHRVLAKASSATYNNCNTVFYSDRIVERIGAACYSHIECDSISSLSLCISAHRNIRFSGNPKEMKRLFSYFNWVIKKSPWRNAFLYPKLSPEIYLKDGLAMNTNKCPQYVIGAMSALRASWEYPYFLDAWGKFQRLGFSKETAFILSNILEKDGRRLLYNTNHATFEISTLYKDNFINFKKGEYPKYEKTSSMNKNARNYRGIFSLFQGATTNSFTDCLKPFYKQTGGGWDVKFNYSLTPEFVKAVKEFAGE